MTCSLGFVRFSQVLPFTCLRQFWTIVYLVMFHGVPILKRFQLMPLIYHGKGKRFMPFFHLVWPTLPGESQRSVSGASIAHSNVVHHNCTDANQPASDDGLDEKDESANTPIGSADSRHAMSFEVDHLPSIRRYYQMQGFSEHITNVLVNLWRPATQKQYTVYIMKWAIFCGTRKITPYLPDLNNVLQFLDTLYYSTYHTFLLIRPGPHNPVLLWLTKSLEANTQLFVVSSKRPLNKTPLLINIMAFEMSTKCYSFWRLSHPIGVYHLKSLLTS